MSSFLIQKFDDALAKLLGGEITAPGKETSKWSFQSQAGFLVTEILFSREYMIEQMHLYKYTDLIFNLYIVPLSKVVGVMTSWLVFPPAMGKA